MKKVLIFGCMVLFFSACSNTSNNNATIDSSVNRGNTMRPDTNDTRGRIPTNSGITEPDTSTHVDAIKGNNGSNTNNGVNGSKKIESGSSQTP